MVSLGENTNTNNNKSEGFLDCFYELASSSAEERSAAGQTLMGYLLKENNNEEDGLYALKRLCEGLCSGRACARQGFASALSLMVQLSYQQSLAWTQSISLPTLRTKLLQYTSASASASASSKKKKGREERDVYFGRLFGILAMIRSQTVTVELAVDYTKDLLSLYHYKYWMREPSIKAIMDLFTFLRLSQQDQDRDQDCDQNQESDSLTCQQLVDTLLLPFLTTATATPTATPTDTDDCKLTAEQYALLWHLQVLKLRIPTSMQFSIDLFLNTDNSSTSASRTKTVLEVMQGTSSVVPPRCHILWSPVLQLLMQQQSSSERHPQLLELFMQKFVYEKLLHVAVSTNERRALALTLMEKLFLALDDEDSVECIFASNPAIVERAFIHKKNALLQPMAQATLQQLIQHCTQSVSKRWTLIQQLLPYDDDNYHIPLLFSDIFKSQHDNNMLIYNQYIHFLQQQLELFASADQTNNDTTNSEHKTRTYIDHLYHFAKRLYHLHRQQQQQQQQQDNDESKSLLPLVQRIVSLLFLYACAPFPNNKLAKGTDDHSVIQTAKTIQLTKELPYSARFMALSRLQSLYFDNTIVSFVYDCWNTCMMQQKHSLYAAKNNHTHNHIMDTMSKTKTVQGMEPLLQLLSLQLLTPGKQQGEEGEEDYDDEDEENQDVLEVLQDLSNLENENFLLELTQICVHLLSSNWAASSKHLRDVILQTWTHQAKNHSNQLDTSIMTILLEAVCGSATLAETMPDDDDEEDEQEEEDDDDEEAVFASAANLKLSDNDDDDDGNEEENMDEDHHSKNDDESEDMSSNKEEDEEVELDASQIEDMLLEDDADEGDILEHHAGADKALAKLLQIKQQSRKAGQEAQEKIQIRQRLFCIGLLERIFTPKYNVLDTKATQNDYVNSVVGISILPLLRARRVLETKQNNASTDTANSKTTTMTTEHSSLLKRLTALLQTIFKVKLPGTADMDGCQVVTRSILEQEFAPSSIRSKVHIQLCQDALRLYVRAVKTPSTLAEQIYSKTIIQEWSTHKRSKFTSSTIQDFVGQCPILSRSTSTSLISSILLAIREGRSPYIQYEAICILSQLYNIPAKYYQDETTTTSTVITGLEEQVLDSISALQSAIQSTDIIKGKRLKDVLKACQHIVTLITNTEKKRDHCLALESWCEPLKSVHDASSSTNMQKSIQSLLDTVSSMVQKQKEMDAEKAAKELLTMEEATSTPSSKKQSSSKKNKSTAKKKKKSKR